MTYLSELHGGTLQKKEMRNVTFEEKYDVIVCGLGTAGSFAALFSAENGLNVLGIEAFTCVGGTHTAGGISGHYFGSPGGRYEAVDEKALAFAREYTCTPTEGRKLIYEEALAESGVTILYESSVCGVFSEDQTVIGLRVLSEGRMIDVGAKIVMDCTAEGTVAAMAGCKTEAGRALDGQMQPYSLVSLWYDGDKYRFNNVDFGRVDQNDPKSLSEAILFARACDLDEAKKGTLVSQTPFLGIREGRRIVAEEGVLLGEVFKGK
ncbi:MAG: FAD-dependent oxidoreductase, partial [Clostridia bacterium]|nr:FAD-dependent oxidoreductase [Clostridia bacterium]